MAIIKPSDLPANATPATTDVLVTEGAAVGKSTIAEVMDTGRPFASQAEAEAGSGTTQTMNPLATKQAIASEVGVTVQAYSTNLNEYAAVNPTAAGLALLDDADAAAQRTTLGLGTMATQAASAVAITGGSIAGITDLAVADGGTGASTAADARTALGLAIGSDVQAYDADLAAIAGLTSAADKVPYFTGSGTAALADFSSFGRSIVDDADATEARATLGVVSGTNVQAYSANLDEYAAVNPTAAGLDLLDDADAAAQRTTLGLGSAAVLTAGDASGNLKALNADGGFTFATTATTIDTSGAFGGTWKTAHRFHSLDTVGGVAGSRATVAIMRESVGSGTNGPSNADYPLHVEVKKTDYLTSAVQGEIDGMNIVVRQGALGDAGGILANIQRVDGAGYGITAFESALSIVDSSGTKLLDLKAVTGGILDSADLRGGGFGFMTRPNDDGFEYDHGLLILGYSSAANTGIETAIECSATMAAADTYFLVTGDQHADGAGRVRATGSAALPAYSFIGDTDTGITSGGANAIAIIAGGTQRIGITTTTFNANIIPTFMNSTAIPAGGTTGSGYKFSTTANFGVFFGSGAPTLTAAKGSLYLRSDGSGTTNRAYINTDSGTTWTALTTAA